MVEKMETGFVPTHVLVDEDGKEFALVKSCGATSFVDFVTYYMGGRAIFEKELTAVGTTTRKLTTDEQEAYRKTLKAHDDAQYEVRELTEQLEVARKKLFGLKAKLDSVAEVLS